MKLQRVEYGPHARPSKRWCIASGRPQCSLLLAGLAAAQANEDQARLTAFLQQTEGYLRDIPNYTCTERVTAFGSLSNGRLRLMGRQEREVAVVYGREMYLTRKGGSFEPPDDTSPVVDFGMVSIGEFSGHLRSLFLNKTLVLDLKTLAPARTGRRRAWQYEFRLPYNLSQWAVDVAGRRERLEGKGVLWFDQETLDLMRLRLLADEGIPPGLPISSIEVEINLARKRIGSTVTILPSKASVEVRSFTGLVRRNEIEFRGCREFGTESTIHFDGEK